MARPTDRSRSSPITPRRQSIVRRSFAMRPLRRGRPAAAGAHREAAAHFARAQPYASALPDRERAAFFEELAREQFLTAHHDVGLAAYDEAIAIWRRLGDRLEEARNLTEAAKSYIAAGRNPDADAVAREVAGQRLGQNELTGQVDLEDPGPNYSLDGRWPARVRWCLKSLLLKRGRRARRWLSSTVICGRSAPPTG